MKLDIEHFDCSCHSPEHTIRFSYDPDENEMFLSTYLNQYRSFWKRLIVGLRYIFRPKYKSIYGDWDCFLLDENDVDKMQKYLIRCKLKGKVCRVRKCQLNDIAI